MVDPADVIVTRPAPEAPPTAESASPPDRGRQLSIIVPVYNEEDNVEPLVEELFEVLDATSLDYEVVLVDDGSRDRSAKRLVRACAGRSSTTVITLARNLGQTEAIAAGIAFSRGDVIVALDADLQNDPRDIPALVAKLDEPPGYDVVSGWRKNRKDAWLTRRLPSKVANWLIARVTHVRIHDYGCTLTAYRRWVLEDMPLTSELHRFLPALAGWQGADVTEMPVNHRPRLHGTTKYNMKRLVKVLFDLVTVEFLSKHQTKPLYFFGKWGLLFLALGLGVLFIAIGQKFALFGQPEGLNLNRNVLTTLSALLVFLSVQSIMLGVVSELILRVYHQTRGRPGYRVRRVYRFRGSDEPELEDWTERARRPLRRPSSE